MDLKGKNLISLNDYTKAEIGHILKTGLELSKDRKIYAELLRGLVGGMMFYEPSTRTRLSFESAILRLGGKVLGFSDAGSSSTKKGESLADTVRVMDDYCDIIVLRHPREGSALLASSYSTVPLINAGDGGHRHPTQTLADIFMLKKEFGRITGLKIAICGDLKFGRTVHSLLETLSRWEGNSFNLISPKELRIPVWLRNKMDAADVDVMESNDLKKGMADADVLYMTRIQKERFFSEEEYLKLKNAYILNADKLRDAPEGMIVMHPLPRVNEIDYDVDNDQRSRYFEEAANSVPVRMALVSLLTGRME